MTPELKERWIEALGTYPKTKNTLKNEEGYCCLGVLADIEGDLNNIIKFGYSFLLPKNKREKYGLPMEIEGELAILNDKTDTFAEVIEMIQKEL